MFRLDIELRDTGVAVARLDGLYNNMSVLPSKYQKLAAEIVMLRLFEILTFRIGRIVCKVACGSRYLDGSTPQLLHRSTSIARAEAAMKTMNRNKPLQYLRWSKVSYVKRNVRSLIDPADHVLQLLGAHVGTIEEMRVVRNRVAHNHGSAKLGYAGVVFARYGARVPGITPGTLLLSPRWTPTILEEYLKTTTTLVKLLVRG